jgi:hypothetical protein
MAKKSKAKRERKERRFEPRSAGNPLLVKVAGALGSIALGAGVYGQFGHHLSNNAGEPVKFAWYILVAGALLLAVAIWFGTSGDPAIRVGDPGVALEKGGLRRMPWYAIDSIAFSNEEVRATGQDELGAPMAVKATLKSQPQAAAWILKEARARIPDRVEVDEEVTLEPSEYSGEVVTLEPMQVVGKRCAISGKTIAYEPDARVCRRCERVYYKTEVPATCECGASLAGLKDKAKAG